MTTDTKRHIDAARQVLVGVVPNPTSQIDQITNALIYKFMDDMDQAAIKQGDEPSFFVGDLERYAWTRLMDPRMGNQERMNLYSEALMKFSESKQLPELFRGIFKSAFLPYRSPEVLGLFLKEIDFFDYSHPEELGNAYEYLLSIMSSQGDAGQFRTPRHIIDFIVDVVNPTENDKVLDPACGTGGFLVSSYKHILEQHDGKDDPKKKEKPLTPDQRRNLMNNFEGYDVDPGMVRIAQVNMYLHQFKNPKIVQYDTLSMEERWGDKFDVILANPPFMSPKGGVKTHSKFSVQSSRSEVLFVDFIMNHLRPKGRAGIIVPEGIIFQSGSAHKQLRKNLVEDGLYAVVSLPSGVFAPYSGVKTSILLFNNELAKISKEILFVKIENDGFDLGATKRSISKNDLPDALEILNKWSAGEKVENKLATYVEKSKIAENGEYNLSGDRYRVTTDYSNAKWPMVFVKDLAFFQEGPGILSSQYVANGYPMVNVRNVQDGYLNLDVTKFVNNEIANDKWAHFRIDENDILFTTSGTIGRVARVKKQDLPLLLNTSVVRFRPLNKKEICTDYLYYSLKSEQFVNELLRLKTGSGQFNVGPTHIKTLKIPLPPLEIQEQIVAELDSYAGIIAGAKQIVQNWKPKFNIDSKWEKVKLGEIIKLSSGKGLTQSNIVAGAYPVYGGNGINGYHNEYFLETNNIVIGRVGAYCGAIHITEPKSWITDNGLYITDYLKEVDIKYLALSLEALNINQFAKTGGQPSISQNTVYELEIPLPPLAIQKQIVEKIEAERVLVGGNKKLIEIYEQKTRDVINKIYA